MNGRAISDNEQLPWDVAQEVLEEANDIFTVQRPFLHQQQQPLIESDATDRRQVIAAQRSVQHWCLATGGVGAHNCRQQVEARLIYPDDSAVFLLRLF